MIDIKQKDRKMAGWLAICLGSFGIHKFYLGQPVLGIIYLLFFSTFIPAVIGVIEGILILRMTDEEFHLKQTEKLRGQTQEKTSIANILHPVKK